MGDEPPGQTQQPERARGDGRSAPRSLLAAARVHPVGFTAAVTLGLWCAFVLVVARAHWSGDIRGFLVLGSGFRHPPALAGAPTSGPYGYDGQFYAALAVDPWLRQADTARTLDTGPYRATRIGVPLLAWSLALGRPAAAILLYQLLCWGLGVAGVLLLAHWLAEEGQPPLWAALLAVSGGLAAAIIRSTPDAAAAALVAAALYLHARRRLTLAVVAAGAAVLVRETSVIAVAAIVVEELFERRWRSAALLAGVPTCLILAWQLRLLEALGTTFASPSGVLVTPLAWLPRKIGEVFGGGTVWWMEAFGLLAVLVAFVAVVGLATRPRAWRAPEMTFVGFGLLGLVVSFDVHAEAWALARALIVLPFLAVVIAPHQAAGWRRWATRSVAVVSAVIGLMMMHGELEAALDGRPLLLALRQGAPVAATTSPGHPEARAAALPTPGPATSPVLYVLPVAHTMGRGGSRWRTELTVANLVGEANTVTIEFLAADHANERPAARTAGLGARETRTFPDVLDTVFSCSGTGALRLAPAAGPIAATGRTADAARPQASAAESPVVPGSDAVPAGVRARLAPLSRSADKASPARTNLSILNTSAIAIAVEIELADAARSPLGRLVQDLGPYEYGQLNDLFFQVGAGEVANGSATLSSSTAGGSFLAVATIIRGEAGEVSYALPAVVW